MSTYSKKTLVVLSAKYLLWTVIHLAILYWLKYLDNRFILPDAAMAVLMIPLGLVNFALLVTGILSLKNFYWNHVLYFLFVVLNFVFYSLISMQMYSQSGAVLN